MKKSAEDIDVRLGQLQSEYVGLEYEQEDVEEDAVSEENNDEQDEVPFNAEKIRIDQQMLSVKYIMELMDGNLMELNPGYQRNRVWKDNKKKSLLIESLMLRIPIPAFYFYENEDSEFQVIDGQQRLSTIHEFINNGFKLTGLEYLGDICGQKYFEDIDIKYKQRIFRTQLAINTLDARSPKKVIYDIFRRINTGGTKLNPQEMRNAICRPSVREFLKRSIENPNYLYATRGLVKDDRMDAQELALRFYAFYMIYDYGKDRLDYDYSSVSLMLDDAIEKMNEMKKGDLNYLYQQFDTAMQRCYQAFGSYCFTKIRINHGTVELYSKNYINKSLFMAFSVLLMSRKYDHIDLGKCCDQIIVAFAEELNRPEYFNAITVGTGDKSRVKQNFESSRHVLEKGCKI